MLQTEFYQNHLDRVSRSFALCIRKLDSPFRQWVSLSYLLCRALDTVEDSPWSSRERQDSQYSDFGAFIFSEPREDQPGKRQAEILLQWSARFPASVPEGERLLLGDVHRLIEDLHALPGPPKRIIQATIGKMLRGMQHYSRRMAGDAFRLTDLTDVNRYCYFVAGVVGELLTELFLIHRPSFQPGPGMKKNALHFGLFLQKVNLLKDQRSDERVGRYFVPDRAVLLSSLKKNADGALNYLLELPPEEKGFRTFCAWSLFLGAASVPWAERAFEARDETKIPRKIAQTLLDAVESIIQDNVALRASFDRYLPPDGTGFSEPADPASPRPGDGSWLHELTGGTLGSSEMTELGLL